MVLQAYCLWSYTSSTSQFVFMYSLRYLLGALGAILSPDLYGLDQKYEVEFFFIEHYLIVLINPLLLLLSGKFVFSLNLVDHVACCALYSLVQRAVLFPISHLSWINLNYSLCHTNGDPLYPYILSYYHIFAEYYLALGEYLVLLPYYQLKMLIDLAKHVLSIDHSLKVQKDK